MIVFTLSTPLFEAPSISIAEPVLLLILFAKILARVVLPHPLAPAKR